MFWVYLVGGERRVRALDLTESRKGDGWLSAYRPENQDQGTTDAHFGRTKVDAAKAAVVAFRQELQQRGDA